MQLSKLFIIIKTLSCKFLVLILLDIGVSICFMDRNLTLQKKLIFQKKSNMSK